MYDGVSAADMGYGELPRAAAPVTVTGGRPGALFAVVAVLVLVGVAVAVFW